MEMYMQRETKLLTKRQTAYVHRTLDRFGKENPSDYSGIARAFMGEIKGSKDAERLTFQLVTWGMEIYFSRTRQKTKHELKRVEEVRTNQKKYTQHHKKELRDDDEAWRAKGIDPKDRAAQVAHTSKEVDRAQANYKESVISDFLSDWKMDDGTSLGDADKEQLLTAAKKQSQMADGHGKNAAFYQAIADRMKGDGSVREEVGLVEVEKLKTSIY